jgi:hypothetical protein
MTKSNHNPVRFATEEMYQLLNAQSDYTFSKLGVLPATLRMHLQLHPEVILVRQITHLDGGYTSLFRHTGSSALIFLRQFSCHSRNDCIQTHGELTITAVTHEDLLRAVFECDRDGTSLDELLGSSDDDDD